MPLLDTVHYQSYRSNCWLNQSTTEPSITMPTISMVRLLQAPIWRSAEIGGAMLQAGGRNAALQ
jgi:hypothetical protein